MIKPTHKFEFAIILEDGENFGRILNFAACSEKEAIRHFFNQIYDFAGKLAFGEVSRMDKLGTTSLYKIIQGDE